MQIRRILRGYGFCSSNWLYTKVPKTVQVEQESGFLARIFSSTKKAPSYILLKQLFEYLQKTEMLQREFPFIKSDTRFEQNWMLVHVLLLRNRLAQFKTISVVEIEKFNYNVQAFLFPQYGQLLNPHIPVKNFAKHFAEVYFKKLELFDQIEVDNDEHIMAIREKGNNEPLSLYGRFLKQVVYEDRVKLEDFQLIKLCKYYAAHRKYLESLEWQDLLEHKVKWGFEGDIKLINNF